MLFHGGRRQVLAYQKDFTAWYGELPDMWQALTPDEQDALNAWQVEYMDGCTIGAQLTGRGGISVDYAHRPPMGTAMAKGSAHPAFTFRHVPKACSRTLISSATSIPMRNK